MIEYFEGMKPHEPWLYTGLLVLSYVVSYLLGSITATRKAIRMVDAMMPHEAKRASGVRRPTQSCQSHAQDCSALVIGTCNCDISPKGAFPTGDTQNNNKGETL